MTSKALRAVADFLHSGHEWMFAWAAIGLAVFLLIHYWPQSPSPVPVSLKTHINFSVIYPQGYAIDGSSWKYLSDSAILEFTAKKGGTNIVFSEEKTPLAYQDDASAYQRFIGSLRPHANFDVPLGTVSISNFVTSSSYEVVGDTGILNAKGTMVLAHPDVRLSDDDWRALFTALKVD